MCSAAESCGGTLDVRSARSLVRTEFNEASVVLWALVVHSMVIAPASPSSTSASKSSRCCRTVFDNFITRYNLGGATNSCGNAAVLLIGKFNCAGDCCFGNAVAGDDMLHVEPGEGPRKFFATIAMYFDAVTGYLLPFLFQNR